jgi:hypothetical protein
MSKATLSINPASKEGRKMADPDGWYRDYLAKKEWKNGANADKVKQSAKKDELNRIENQEKRKIRNGETVSCLMMTILVSTFGFNNEADKSEIFKNFNGAIILNIIPTTDGGRDTYYNEVIAYLTPAVLLRLHILPAHFTAFSELMGPDRSSTGTPPGTNSTHGTWNYVYPLQKIKGTTTEELTTAKDALIIEINAAIHVMFADISDNSITPADTTALHITPKADHKAPQETPAEITALVYPQVIALGGFKVNIKSRQAANAKRGKKLNKAVSIEHSYVLVAAGAPIPSTVPEGATVIVVTKADFILELTSAAAGMRIVVFSRWIYPSHPKQSGGYGNSGNDIVS